MVGKFKFKKIVHKKRKKILKDLILFECLRKKKSKTKTKTNKKCLCPIEELMSSGCQCKGV